MNTTLLIMAAGIGSRFGTGIKQLEPVDDAGHIIMDYSIHDAIEAGFNHVVFIIRKDIEKEFKEVIGDRIASICSSHNVTVDYAFQDINDIPGTLPEGRTKPWGTGQAVLAAKKVLDTPFIVINADDYYGNLKVSELAKLLADKLYVFALTITEEDARKRFIDRVRKLQLRKNRETMLRDAMSVYPISMQAFDRNKYFFNCKNGTLDMRTLEFREHRPEDYLTMESGITYNPDADCPRWHSFIKEVMCGDADLADFLQRSLGYALTGDTSQECMFILYGATSRNGKGTAMETFLKIMGDYGKTSNPDMLAAKFRGGNTGGPSEEVARLVDSRFVNISEPEKKITFNAALVKRMTGNDTINARFLNENSFDFVPVFKIFINTNYLPNVNDMTLFQSGRLKIIPFNRHFEEGEQDQGLKGQFAKPENLSGIFNWCLEGYKKFCQRGLELPQAVTKATEDYKDDSDRIGQFIEAWLEKEDGSELRTAAAYQLYTKWCEENGYSSENQKNFKNAIGVHFKVVRKRPKGGGGQTTLIMDCKFKEVEAGAEDLTVQDAYKPKDSLL